jgi:transcriptional regulator with XRE-family HTH domain
MYRDYRNIYQTGRENAGLTQEAVAELLDISVESVRAYESGLRVPKNKLVENMAITFRTEWLLIEHLLSDEVAGKHLPRPMIEFTLSQAALWFLKELESSRTQTTKLISLTCANELEGEQQAEFESLMQELFSLAAAVLTLRFCDKKGMAYGKTA